MKPSLELFLRWRRRVDQRGAVGVIVALGMTVFLGMAAVAVDLGHMMNVRTESQRVADLAALAGASAFLQNTSNVVNVATVNAQTFAAQNTVDHTAVNLPASDVIVDVVNERVRVWVRHTSATGNPITTIFARILGINDVDVTTTAVAEARNGGGVNCVLPLAMPDRWEELGGNPDYYDPGIDNYIPWDPMNPGDPYTGYSDNDIGVQIVIKPNQGGGNANTSWYYPWRPPNQQGGADYRTNINSCVDPSLVYYVGQVVPTEPGAMIGPTKQGFGDLIDQDPNAAWNYVLNCVTDQVNAASANPAFCRGSPRLRPMPMFDPTQTPDPGVKPFTFTNFAGVFVDYIQGNNVYAVFAGFAAVAPAGGGGSGNNGTTQFKWVVLIE